MDAEYIAKVITKDGNEEWHRTTDPNATAVKQYCKANGQKFAGVILNKDNRPTVESEALDKVTLNKALKTGLIDELLKQAAQVEDQGASLYAQEALRQLFAKEPGADYDSIGFYADAHDKVAAATYNKTVGKRVPVRGAEANRSTVRCCDSADRKGTDADE